MRMLCSSNLALNNTTMRPSEPTENDYKSRIHCDKWPVLWLWSCDIFLFILLLGRSIPRRDNEFGIPIILFSLNGNVVSPKGWQDIILMTILDWHEFIVIVLEVIKLWQGNPRKVTIQQVFHGQIFDDIVLLCHDVISQSINMIVQGRFVS